MATPSDSTLPAPAFRARSSAYLIGIIVCVILMSGLLFGYDQGVISGALSGIKRALGLSPLLIEVVTSWVTLGALFGSLAAGELADRIGRKKTVLTAAVLFILGALIQASAPHTAVLVAGRLVVGFGVGVAAVAAPLYGSETAQATWRGRLVSAYQMAITIGIFLAYLVNGALSDGADWRMMLGLAAVPGILLALFALAAPESPRWLIKQGRPEAARNILARLLNKDDCQAELNEIENALRLEAGAVSWREVFKPIYRKPLAIGIGLAVFQQVTGINAIIYYANPIFAASGFATPEAQAAATTWGIGATNVLSTLIAIAFIDRIGRVPLLLAGLIGMGASLATVGLAFQFFEAPGDDATYGATITVVALVIFIASFAFSLGPVVWTVINEVFPSRVRSRGVAISTAVNWAAAFVVSEFFLSLVQVLGRPFTFWLFALLCLVGWIWIYRKVPETKGRSLEEIEQLWHDPSVNTVRP
ncbi:sugar porter family MFS transporter [Mesorhizobium sp. CN2-181]|uniref:sugar porter family MFS transporter n=1 Tax=Mesorhizobium yinganensis TaxID=3157707 RepID=UPI0032B75891